jgi:hypothetical protein
VDVTLAAATRARRAGALQLAAAVAAQAPGAEAALAHPKLGREHRQPAQVLVALRAVQALVASHPSLSMKKTPERSDSCYGVRCGTLGADACFSVASSVRSI